MVDVLLGDARDLRICRDFPVHRDPTKYLSLAWRSAAGDPAGTDASERKPRDESGLYARSYHSAILFALLICDFFTGNAIYATPEPNALSIKIIGHQWWWEVEYQDPQPSEIVTTANEIHVPVGKPVKLELQSSDVIHSFWLPNIHGKKDLVPGHPTTTWFTARRAGEFRGQCAEYCGEQHAHMRLVFVAEAPDAFSAWLDAQKKSAPDPTSDSQRRGRDVFLASQCVMCHTIQGTRARATLGPDLTHIGGRKMIAAGELPNTRGYLAGWILNASALKPGVRMPPNQLSADDLNALLDYLESLK